MPTGSSLRFDGNTNNLNSGSILSGAGSVTVASGTTNINGTYTHTGPLNVTGGIANWSPALNNNALSVTGGTLNVNSASSVPSLTLSGFIGGSGNLTVNGATTWSNGGFEAANTSVSTIFNGPLTMNGGDHQISTRRLELNGATSWTAARILIGFGASMVNNPGGVFTASGEQDFQYWGGATAVFDNLGTFNRNVIGTTTTIPNGIVFNNSSSTVRHPGAVGARRRRQQHRLVRRAPWFDASLGRRHAQPEPRLVGQRRGHRALRERDREHHGRLQHPEPDRRHRRHGQLQSDFLLG